MEIRGSVALGAGAGAGTGRAMALRLGAEGALVVVVDVDPQAGREAARAIEERGGRARFVQADVTSSDDVRRMVAFAEQGLNLNLRGAMLATQLALGPMRLAGVASSSTSLRRLAWASVPTSPPNTERRRPG